jgi:hypothetical protein
MMQFIRLHKKNEDGLEECKVDPVKKKLAWYKQKWLNNVSRMEETGTKNNSFTIYLLEEEDENYYCCCCCYNERDY